MEVFKPENPVIPYLAAKEEESKEEDTKNVKTVAEERGTFIGLGDDSDDMGFLDAEKPF